MKKLIRKFPKKSIWGVFLMVLVFLTSCSMPGSVPPTPIPTLAPPTMVPTPTPLQPPTIRVLSGSTEIETILGSNVTIEFSAQSSTGVTFVELTKDSISGQSVASYGSPDSPQGEETLQSTMNWVPDKPGKYNLYLTAYNPQKLASVPTTISVTVFAKPKIVSTGLVALQHGDSYDFVTNKKGDYSGGDLYVINENNNGFVALANNVDQGGGLYLYDLSEVPSSYYNETVASLLADPKIFKMIYSEDTQMKFTHYDVPIDRTFGLYLYKREKPPGEYILFIGDVGDIASEVLLDFVVFEMPK